MANLFTFDSGSLSLEVSRENATVRFQVRDGQRFLMDRHTDIRTLLWLLQVSPAMLRDLADEMEPEDNTMLESLVADVAALQASTEQFNANYGITLVWCGLEGFESELRAVDAMPDDTPEAKVRKAKEVNRLRNWFNDSKQHIESARVRDLQLRLNAGRAIYGLLTELWESITDHLDPDNINALLGTDLCNRINAAITGKLPTP